MKEEAGHTMAIDSSALERPLPKPSRGLADYAAARALEALLEALLALEFLERGYTRNAAGKAFQAWRALTATLLALEAESLARLLGSEEERRWLLEKAIPRVPSSRLKRLGQLLEEAGVPYYASLTSTALDLHDYQYHGPDPDAELSKYRSREEAAYDITTLVKTLAGIIEERVKPKLLEAGKWSSNHEEALHTLKRKLEASRSPHTGR